MEMHHKLRRDPTWDPRGCNLCGQLGHQAAECPNGTVNWKGIYGDEAFIVRPPVYESYLAARRQRKRVDEGGLAARAKEFAQRAAQQQGLSWEEVEQAAEASQRVVIEKVAVPAAAGGGGGPEDGLPEGWAVAYDPSGKPYYWHKATQKTQWDKPTA